MYAIKIKNCSITKPRADALQASLSPHKLPLPAQLVFFFRKVTSSCRRVYHCLGLRSSLLYFSFLLINFFLKTARTNKRSSNVPAAFLVSDRLDHSQLQFTDVRSHLLAQPQPSNFSPRFYNSSDRHGEFFTFKTFGGTFALSQLKRGVEAV